MYNEEEIIIDLRDPAKLHRAFGKVVEQFSKPLYWHIRQLVISHADADDILQNTFLKAWNSIEYFRAEAKLSTWLYRIATNEALTYLAKQRREHEISLDQDDSFLLTQLHNDEWFDGDAIQQALQEAVLTLPEKQRLVFNMRYFDEIKYEDISRMVGTSVGALKASYHIASKKVEEYVTRKLEK